MTMEEILEEILEETERKDREKWERKTPQEKIEIYKEQLLYRRYCDMTIEELEAEKQFNMYMSNKLRNSFFSDPYYSAYGCDENVRRINTILKLKKENNNEKDSN